MNIFLDCEFTGLTKEASLISLALYVSEEEFFYAEFNDVDESLLNDWVKDNVMDKLEFNSQEHFLDSAGGIIKIKGDRKTITRELKTWLSRFDKIEIWGDVPHYDWVLFCDLFGGAREVPINIFYAPFDLATILRVYGYIKPKGQYDQDISRFEFAGMDKENQHNALNDCRAEKACLENLKRQLNNDSNISI